MVARYHVADVSESKVAGTIEDILDQVARHGAQVMLQRALETEVEEYLQRPRYQRGGEFRGYRNGHGRERTVGIGTWAVPVKVPRVSDTPDGSTFESAVTGWRGIWPSQSPTPPARSDWRWRRSRSRRKRTNA
jgi:hypothetical protein